MLFRKDIKTNCIFFWELCGQLTLSNRLPAVLFEQPQDHNSIKWLTRVKESAGVKQQVTQTFNENSEKKSLGGGQEDWDFHSTPLLKY